MHIRSKTLEMLRAGKIVFSSKYNTADPRMVGIAAMMGIPCIWVDTERGGRQWPCLLAGRLSASRLCV